MMIVLVRFTCFMCPATIIATSNFLNEIESFDANERTKEWEGKEHRQPKNMAKNLQYIRMYVPYAQCNLISYARRMPKLIIHKIACLADITHTYVHARDRKCIFNIRNTILVDFHFV